MKSCWEEISFCSIFVCWLVTIKADCVDFICWLTKQFLIEIWKICSHKKGTLFFFFSDIKFWLEWLEWPQVTTIQNIGSKAKRFSVGLFKMRGHTMFHFYKLHVEIFNFSFYSYSPLIAFHFHFNIHFQGVSLASYKVVVLEQHSRCQARHLFPPFKRLRLGMIQTNKHLLWCKHSVWDCSSGTSIFTFLPVFIWRMNSKNEYLVIQYQPNEIIWPVISHKKQCHTTVHLMCSWSL